jgi:hypothetical protein
MRLGVWVGWEEHHFLYHCIIALDPPEITPPIHLCFCPVLVMFALLAAPHASKAVLLEGSPEEEMILAAQETHTQGH